MSFDIDTVDVVSRTCVCCKQPITRENTFTEPGWKEVEITSMCEVCFDYNTLYSEELDIDFVKKFEVFELCSEKVFIAGGVFRHMVDPLDEVKDIDMFFSSIMDATGAMEWLEDNDYKKVFECPLGELYTYSKEGQPKIQLITKFYYSDVDTLISTFDFTACCAGFDGRRFVCNKRFYSDVRNKRIHFNAITYPVATLNRLTKYVRKGYYLPPSQNLHFIETLNSMELNEDNMVYYID